MTLGLPNRHPLAQPAIRASNCREAYIRRAACAGSIGLPPITADKIAERQILLRSESSRIPVTPRHLFDRARDGETASKQERDS